MVMLWLVLVFGRGEVVIGSFGRHGVIMVGGIGLYGKIVISVVDHGEIVF